jgi:Mycothiol maleylpyruvate isomerase N-terminal domain
MPELGLLTVTASDGQDLLAVAQDDWSRPVPDCPGWTSADLVGHMGAILGWMTKIVTTGEAVPRRDRESPPADRDTLAAWYKARPIRRSGLPGRTCCCG